jgi:hypothetical protein
MRSPRRSRRNRCGSPSGNCRHRAAESRRALCRRSKGSRSTAKPSTSWLRKLSDRRYCRRCSRHRHRLDRRYRPRHPRRPARDCRLHRSRLRRRWHRRRSSPRGSRRCPRQPRRPHLRGWGDRHPSKRRKPSTPRLQYCRLGRSESAAGTGSACSVAVQATCPDGNAAACARFASGSGSTRAG